MNYRAGKRTRAWVRWRASSSSPPSATTLPPQVPEEVKQKAEKGTTAPPPTLSSILMTTLGGEPSGTSLGHFHEPFTLCSELLDAAFDATLELRRRGCGSEEDCHLRIFWIERPNLGC